MTNLPTPFGPSKVALRDVDRLRQALEESDLHAPAGGAPDGSVFLNFSGKHGVYKLGRNGEAIDPDDLWLVNILSFEDGWMCWKGNQPVAQRLANIYSGVHIPTPDPSEFGPFKDSEGWMPAKGMILKNVYDGVQAYWKVSSKSAVDVFADLRRNILAQIAKGGPAWPLVRLGMEKFGQYDNWKPTISVRGWLSDEAVAVLAEDPDADIEDLIAQSNPAPVPAPSQGTKGRRRL
jgi:hypothetical protein